MKFLVTGAAGFIGMHVCERLLARGDTVLGIDDLNPYYDPALKQARLARLQAQPGFSFERLDIADRAAMQRLFAGARPARVIHLAAQAGVRYSLTNPAAYIDTNLVGFGNVLEGCRHNGVEHLAYASSSSVYGGNKALPFSEHQTVDHPVSLYAATKKANELMAHTYSHLFGLPTTGLRFFTVYGPWGRPDMALFLFTKAILAGDPIQVFNHGAMQRDFTYIDDAVESTLRLVDRAPGADPSFDATQPDPARSDAPYRVFNVGNNDPASLMAYIEALEAALGRQAVKQFLPMQPGDVPATAADTSELQAWTGFKPATAIDVGVKKFAQWYLGYFDPGSARR
jgi:UDP-glucuronate 4-epimerase